MAVKKGGLGRGLDSLFNENSSDQDGAVKIKLSEIEPNRAQPRHGLLQPIIVRPMTSGGYQIVAGERRWRACRMAGLTEVPVIIKELDDRAFTEIALIENLQREDLNAVEEAEGYKTLMETYGLTQEQVAETVGKSRPAVTNAMRLLGLDDASREALRRGIISAGHARALLSVEDADLRGRMLLAASDGASVRELERMAAASKKTAAAPRKIPPAVL